jgi:hypothetical protein
MARSPATVGERAETVVVDALGLEQSSGHTTDWKDAETGAGQPVEIKACAHTISNGEGEVPGRWWIQRSNHHALLDAEGLYALVVYDETLADLTDVALLVVPATVVDPLLSWTTAGDSHRSAVDGDNGHAKLSWRHLFDPDTVREVVSGGE